MGKLIRDKIPLLMQQQGKTAKVRQLSHHEYLTELKKKLQEEVDEYRESEDLEELADIVEVVFSLVEACGMHLSEFSELRKAKLSARGGFRQRYYMDI